MRDKLIDDIGTKCGRDWKQFSSGNLKAKSSFLVTCADKKHNDCNVKEDGLCSELAVKACDFVRPLYDAVALSTFRRLEKEFKFSEKIALATAFRADYL
ncbi:hypothetical protein BV898_19543 [Hypsibius exemplaris]|uniref:Uncharacterized protein n=1 Tax=Hypsibius exemplaris TaxID=2072580 RepID=A0A9X6NLU3_HYPEX|nr:hypothetical protein BV898_19543 [Hypsibius exemplaris]